MQEQIVALKSVIARVTNYEVLRPASSAGAMAPLVSPLCSANLGRKIIKQKIPTVVQKSAMVHRGFCSD